MLATVSDGARDIPLRNRKWPVFSEPKPGKWQFEHFQAELLSASEYYPFGMEMPGRIASSESYRYGFNGKEKDDEIKGSGVQYDYGFRVYDARIGKFLSVDPLSPDYPWYTPYQFAGNKPIWAIDLDGLEELVATIWNVKDDGTAIRIENAEGKALKNISTGHDWVGTRYVNHFFHDGEYYSSTAYGEAQQNLKNETGITINELVYTKTSFSEINRKGLENPEVQRALKEGGIIGGVIVGGAVLGSLILGASPEIATSEIVIEEMFEAATGIPVVISPEDLLKLGWRAALRNQVKSHFLEKYGKETLKGQGSYTIKYSDGTNYHGKGPFKEAIQGGYRKSNGDLPVEFDWTPSTDSPSAFRDEARRLNADGGHKSETNRNLIDSPGNKKYKIKD